LPVIPRAPWRPAPGAPSRRPCRPTRR
jgi:hypothetical protein